jgi:hypothetical protein
MNDKMNEEITYIKYRLFSNGWKPLKKYSGLVFSKYYNFNSCDVIVKVGKTGLKFQNDSENIFQRGYINTFVSDQDLVLFDRLKELLNEEE